MFLHSKVMKLFSRLKAVGQEKQLTHNVYVMNQAFYQMPEKFSDRLSVLRKEWDASGDANGPDAMWKAFKKFVDDEIETIQTYRAFNLTTSASKNDKHEKHDSKSKPKSIHAVKPSSNSSRPPPTTSVALHSDPNIRKNQQKFGL